MSKWYEQSNTNSDVAISSRIRLARNLRKYSFPNRLSEKGAEQMIEEIKSAILNSTTDISDKFKYIDLREKTLTDKIALMESRIISRELVKKALPAGVLLYEEEGISIMINEEDHLRIQCMAGGMQIDEAWKMANRIDDIIEENIEYAFSEKYGYLTACPTNVGTGLRASYMLHLPALEAYGQLQFILQAIGKFGITVRGIYGEGTEVAGSVFQISNQITLGQSEEEIIDNLNNVTNQIVDQERKIREKLMKERRSQFEDKVYRSYGILSNARVVSSKEAMTLLSDVKLGFELGILKSETENMNIYELMIYIQPANLQKIVGKELSLAERDIQRASFIREHIPKIV